MKQANLKKNPKQQPWSLVISSRSPWFDLHLAELWRYRDLIGLFIQRDFVSAYKQTILGPVWYLIQPLLTTLVFTVIFNKIANLPTEGVPPFLFYMAGTVIWTYFADCLTKTSNTFINNSNLFGKVYFPRLAVPLAILISNLITFAIQFALFLLIILFLFFTGLPPQFNGWILLTPFLLIMMAGLGLGFGITISSLTTKYRDLRFLVQFGVQLLMYATPVIYPVSAIPDRYQWLIQLNPLTAIMETFRYAFLDAGTVHLGQLGYSFGFMIVVVFIGAIIFNRVEATFMDTV